MSQPAASPEILRFEDYVLDPRSGELRKAGRKIKLQEQPFQILAMLLRHAGEVVTREELRQELWPENTFVDFDHSLNTAVKKLRHALNDEADKPRLVETLPKRGYRFVGCLPQNQPADIRDGLRRPERDADLSHRSTPVESAAVSEPAEAATVSAVDSPPSTERCKLPLDGAPRKHLGLPAPRTSLIGRDQEVAEAAGLLLRPDVRLLTITGAGGAGKTRLAIAVAFAVADSFPAGVQFVGLASITHRELVGIALAEALDIQQVANRTVPELIAERLRDSESFLLVLDNFEQVLAAATVLAEILAACRSMKMLVTSRESLRI